MTKWSVSALAAAFIVGAVIGGAVNQPHPLRAASAPVYTIYEVNVTDPDGYKNQFLSLAGPKLEKHGNKFLARGGKTQSLIGDEAENRIVLGEYPSMGCCHVRMLSLTRLQNSVS
jgi:uncharacterized protein (DUF1330 family)